MPDLGKYASDIYAAYGITFVLLVALLVHSVWRAKRVKTQLIAAEARLSAAKDEASNG